MANEMSDSDDDKNDPQVTTFDEPQSVTFGGTPASQAAEGWDDGNHDRPTPPAAPMDGSGRAAAAVAAPATATAAAASTAPRPKALPPITDAELAANGAAVSRGATSGASGASEAGHRVLHYVWRQARAEVTVVVPAPAGTRAGDVKVSLRTKPETISEGVADLIRGGVEEVVLLEGELAFQAKLDGEGDDVDWELKDFPGTVVARGTSHGASTSPGLEGKVGAELTREGAKTRSSSSNSGSPAIGDHRGIEVVLRKHCPVPNAVVWWKSLLNGGPEIDVASIQGRSANNHQSVWEEALGMFKEKVAARKNTGQISVDMGGGD
ncbi:unnamed protein product [Laminaria digitata]